MVNFNIEDIKRIIKLYSIKQPERFNFIKLANYLGLRTSDPRFVKIEKYLINKKILTIIEELGANKIIKLNKNKLKEEIPEIEFIRFLHDECIHKIYKKTIWIYND